MPFHPQVHIRQAIRIFTDLSRGHGAIGTSLPPGAAVPPGLVWPQSLPITAASRTFADNIEIVRRTDDYEPHEVCWWVGGLGPGGADWSPYSLPPIGGGGFMGFSTGGDDDGEIKLYRRENENLHDYLTERIQASLMSFTDNLIAEGVGFADLLDPPPTVPVYGCTDPAADNYDPKATVDDGTCLYDGEDFYGNYKGGDYTGASGEDAIGDGTNSGYQCLGGICVWVQENPLAGYALYATSEECEAICGDTPPREDPYDRVEPSDGIGWECVWNPFRNQNECHLQVGGSHATQGECEVECTNDPPYDPPEPYDGWGWQCQQRSGDDRPVCYYVPGGGWATEQGCLDECTVPDVPPYDPPEPPYDRMGWECQPVVHGDISEMVCVEVIGGRFSTEAECQVTCHPPPYTPEKWKCVFTGGSTYTCIQAEDGTFDTFDECMKDCGPPPPPYDPPPPPYDPPPPPYDPPPPPYQPPPPPYQPPPPPYTPPPYDPPDPYEPPPYDPPDPYEPPPYEPPMDPPYEPPPFTPPPPYDPPPPPKVDPIDDRGPGVHPVPPPDNGGHTKCEEHDPWAYEGAERVFVENLELHRIDDALNCCDIAGPSPSRVFVGGRPSAGDMPPKTVL